MADRRYTINAFTVNLELPPSDIRARHGSVSDSLVLIHGTERLLALLETYDVRATFFVDPNVIARGSAVIRQIIRAGHEPAVLAPKLPPSAAQLPRLRQGIGTAKQQLQEMLGREVVGFRAARIGRSSHSPSVIDMLVQQGFAYSSSSYPPSSPHIDLLAGRRKAHRLHGRSGVLWELPLTCWCPFGIGMPLIRTGGGPIFSHLPVWMTARGIQGMNRHGEPAILHLHSWSLEASVQQHGSQPPFRYLRRYASPDQTIEKLESIFRSCRFGSIREAFASRLSVNHDERPRHYRSGILRYDGATPGQNVPISSFLIPPK